MSSVTTSTTEWLEVPVGEVLGGGVQVVALEVGERRSLFGTLPLLGPSRKYPPGRAVLSYPCRPREQLGLCFVQLGLHVLWLLSRAVV
ncbi:hypothetical protein Slala03_77450 [Streptomyces lavendulae subsp. lavendulae]|nr:hypothetical protein Slala03_77450 [Streptomyces lavendulae subsp. lavendulae]